MGDRAERGSEARENLSDSARLKLASEVWGKFKTDPCWEGAGKKLLREGAAELLKLLREGVAETKPEDWEEEREMVPGRGCCWAGEVQ